MSISARPVILWAAIAAATASVNVQAAAQEVVYVSATRVEQSEVPLNSLSVIDEKAIETVAHTHISELLNRAPGVWISRGNGQEHLTAIRSAVLSGGGTCGAFYMAEDGIPLRAPGFCNANQLFDANTEQAARIEIIRGPGTAVHGSNALNGVVNVISRVPTAEPSTKVSLEGGPHNYGRLKLEHSQGTETHRFGINANGAHDGGYKDDSGFDQQKMTLRYDYSGDSWSAKNVLAASNLNQETAGYIYGKGAYKIDSLKKTNSNPEAFRDTNSTRFYSRWERDGSQDTHIVLTPYMRHTDMEFLQHFLPGTPLEENGHDSIGIQTAFYRAGDETLLHHGFDLDYTEGYLKETQGAPSFAVFPSGKHYDYDVKSWNGAWFVGGEWTPKSSRELSAGLRYEFQQYDYNNNMIDGNADENGVSCPVTVSNPTGACRYSRPSDDKDTFRDWSAYFGFREDLDDNLSAILNLSHGFRAPQATELYRLQATQLKADIDSERVTNAEIGLRGDWESFRGSVTAYHLVKDEIILQNSARENYNGGKTLRRGIEIEVNWQIAETLTLSVQESYAKTQYDNNAIAGTKGNEVDTAPRQMASAQLRWQPLATTSAELEWVHMGSYYLDENNSAKYPGHDLINLRVQQRIMKGLSVALRVTNLTDTEYAERADYAFGNYRYFVGEPRSAYISLTAEF